MANFIDFHIGGWKVGSIAENSGVFAGETIQSGWRTSQKINQPSRAVTGDGNVVWGPQNYIEDADLLDTWIQKTPPKAGYMSPNYLRRLSSKRHDW